jgi:hypothetical protein
VLLARRAQARRYVNNLSLLQRTVSLACRHAKIP